MVDINFSKIEKKWQEKWEKAKAFSVGEFKNKKKYYVLEMFPYPSGSGLHMGHALNYTIGDIYARFKRMNGFNVLYPMGYDAFGLPAENAAIKEKTHPKKYTDKAVMNFIKQQKELGLSYDWSRLIKTCDSEYYKWNQYFFLKFLEKGLAYRKKAAVNFCPKCDTVLANEQVHNGKCWRHEETDVEIRHLEQWFLKTTKYADELLEDAKELKWPERIKAMQENWIGKSNGSEIVFSINNEKWPIFTTRPDTIYGVTFMVISSQHPRLMELVTEKQKKEVEKFLKKLKTTSEKDIDELDKEGAFTGSYAINPINNEKIPVYTGNFVLADYGSGMVMAVPAHDQRDFEFAKKYNIPIRVVINPPDFDLNAEKMSRAYVGDGKLANSEKFNGWNNKEAIDEIVRGLEKKKLGRKTINYKLRDWLISRQRYWGAPIPIVYCEKCGIVHVPYNELPVLLPEKVKFGKGNPLLSNKKFIETKCPKCKGKAKRESDTMDTFFDSSWYFLRYCDNKNNKEAFDKKKVEYWMPVDHYIGGAEHACMHLIYARFFTKALRDLGFLKFSEPFTKLFNQGMLHGEDGFVMSKSRGNVALPEEVSKKYGIDTARLFLVSIASPDKDIQWDEHGIEGSLKFVIKIFDFFKDKKFGKSSEKIQSKVNKSIKDITEDIENFRYNMGIIKIRELFDKLNEEKEIGKSEVESFLKMLSVFCPHVCEELWERIGNKGKVSSLDKSNENSKIADKSYRFISLEKWPVADEKKINEKYDKEEKAIESLITDIRNIMNILEKKGETKNKITIYVIPNEMELYKEAKEKVEKIFNLKTEIHSIQEAGKTGKTIKAKPGKPGLFLE